METWLPDMFVEDAQKGRFIQRQGASLSLRAYGLGDALRANPYSDSGPLLNQALAYGDIMVDPGAVLRVDDGQSINLDDAEKMLIAGRIEARSGSVALTAAVGSGHGWTPATNAQLVRRIVPESKKKTK